jgi:D-alanine-D-alanine ligase
LQGKHPNLEVVGTKNEIVLGTHGNWGVKTGNEYKSLFVDVVFPVLHGTYGEDGRIQGLLESLFIPFVGQKTYGSFISANKHILKILLDARNIKNSPFVILESMQQIVNKSKQIEKLGFPVFVKPSNAGSSFGVTKVKSKDELKQAISYAFKFDNTVLVEKEIKGRELECAVLGDFSDIRCASIGEIKTDDFYTVDEKYSDSSKAKVITDPQIEKELEKNIIDTAKEVYKVIQGTGLARIDFLVRDDGELFVNEINTMPGFLDISLFPSLMNKKGLGYKELITHLIETAWKTN